MWSFCHPGGSETEQPSSGAMAERECFTVSEAHFSFGGRHRFLFWQRKGNGVAKRGPMSTREGQAASVTLLRREQLRSASAPTNTTGSAAEDRGRRAGRVVRPYKGGGGDRFIWQMGGVRGLLCNTQHLYF